MSALSKRKRGHQSVLSLLRQREYTHQSNGYVDSIQHCLLRWMLTHLSPSPYALLELDYEGTHSQTPPTLTRASVSCLEFDALGVLLAAGGIDGSISLFDFDIYLHQTLNLDQRANELEEQSTDEPIRNVPTEPIHVIQTGHHVRCIRWNPSNQDEIACSFVNLNAIYFYNLSTFRTKPNRIIRLSNHPSVGYKEITFMNSKRHTNQSRSKSQLLAIDDDGCIRLWELQRNSQRLSWIIKTGLQHLFTAILIHNRHLLCGTHDGIVTIYNIDDLVTPPFESLATPRKIRSFNVIETGKHLWHRHSSPPRLVKITTLRDDFILCHFQHNWIAVINVIDWSIVQYFTDRIGPGTIPNRELNPPQEVLGCFSFLYKQPENRNMSSHIGITVFNKAFYCMLSKDFGNKSILEVIDLCPPRGAQFGVTQSIQGEIPVCDERAREIRRLDRFRVPLDRAITLVTAHPSRHFFVGVSHTLKNLIIFDIVRTQDN